MNYHLLIDEKFIDSFIEGAEKACPGNNTYVYTFSGKPQSINNDIGISKPIGSEGLAELMRSIHANDRIFIHWFSNELWPYIEMLKPETQVSLMFWGGDLLEQTKEQLDFNLLPHTRALYDRMNKRSMFYRTFHPGKLLQQLYLYITVDKRWDEKRMHDTAIRKAFLKRLNYICHWNQADVDRVVEAYGGNPKLRMFFYPFGMEKIQPPKEKQSNYTPLIWLGNSASFTNNHLDAMESIAKFNDKDFRIIVPLSYGHKKYGQQIAEYGERRFGNKFEAIKDFMPLTTYLKKLEEVDVVLMNHNRLQAGGNVYAFLMMGKKLFLRSSSTFYDYCKANGLHLFAMEDIDKMSYDEFVQPLTLEQQMHNYQRLKEMFSEENYLKYLKDLLQ